MRIGLFKTVATRIIIMMLCYAIIVTSLIISFSYYIIYTNQRLINVQSAESNLKLASQNIDRDLAEVIALAGWCGSRSNAPARFLTRPYNPIEAVNSFTRILEEKRNNRSARYIKRILVVSKDGSKVLHVSDTGSNPLVLPGNNSEKYLEKYELSAGANIYDIDPDPYSQAKENVLKMLAPVYSTSSTTATTVKGTVYIAVDTSIITDSLKGYATTADSDLLLTIGEQVYQIGSDGLFPIELSPDETNVGADYPVGETAVGRTADANGSNVDIVSCKIREGIFLTQSLRSEKLLTANSWTQLLAAVCWLIMALSAAVIWTMNRTISRPVARIRKKTEAIANGDFSPDFGIESDNEIGEVGRSINQLSRNVVELMDKRLADEQNKRELEYRMLQGQISPHFLYNTLGTIKWMATLQKAGGIAEMTTALSQLLRTTAKDLRKVVPLRDEIALLDDYYTILKYRYGGTIEYNKHIEDEDLLEIMLPRFVLQPLMENAIFHGIEPKGKGRLELTVERRDGLVYISITDDGIGLSRETLNKIGDLSQAEQTDAGAAGNGLSSVGLRNVHQRIQNVFGAEYGVTVESEENTYTKVKICVPYSLAEPSNNSNEGKNSDV